MNTVFADFTNPEHLTEELRQAVERLKYYKENLTHQQIAAIAQSVSDLEEDLRDKSYQNGFENAQTSIKEKLLCSGKERFSLDELLNLIDET